MQQTRSVADVYSRAAGEYAMYSSCLCDEADALRELLARVASCEVLSLSATDAAALRDQLGVAESLLEIAEGVVRTTGKLTRDLEMLRALGR